MEEKLRIGGGKTEAFLVCDKSLESIEAPFFSWLREEGFTFGGYHGNYGCWWAHINITRKQYAYGMPGVGLAKPIGNHAITIEEFKEIYSIYKKYDGKELFAFQRERFDYEKQS
jgi:hypothetical protein